jgi:hypothetical protein
MRTREGFHRQCEPGRPAAQVTRDKEKSRLTMMRASRVVPGHDLSKPAGEYLCRHHTSHHPTYVNDRGLFTRRDRVKLFYIFTAGMALGVANNGNAGING